jgi:serine/threonine-protein kinase
MDTDRNLLFGVLALQGEMIDSAQFAEACTAWSARKDRPLADLLVERGWLRRDERRLVDQLLEHKLKKHAGDAHQSLVAAAAASDGVRDAVGRVQGTLADADIHGSLADVPLTHGGAIAPRTLQYVSQIGYSHESRDRYTLSTVHAKGGIGQVWLARDSELDREVALKELRPEQAGKALVLQRFLQEARITGQLDHPGVVPIYELVRGDQAPGGRPYYTMRFIRGRTLRDAIRDYHQTRVAGKARRTDLLALLQAFVGVCNTVAFAHSRGVIHRDLKGPNIVLGEFGEVVLLDWGLAKMVDRAGGEGAADADLDPVATIAWPGPGAGTGTDMTVAGQALGTPAYMAPEQAEGRLDRIGRATDVYGLGAILYDVLAGRPPFEGSSTQEVLRKVVEQPADPPRRFNPQAPRALQAVCMKALAKDPGDRYASATELAGDVQHWLADEPVSAWREPWAGRARRWVSHNRTLVAAGAAALVVAVAGLTVLAVAQTHANQELKAALGRETIARDDATERLSLAQDALQSFYSGISEDVILRRPELTDLRQRLLGTALGFYEKLERSLEKQAAQTKDPLAMRNMARALDRVASLQSLLGNRDEAIRIRRKVVDIYDKLPGDAPLATAEAVLDLGNLQRLAGRPDDALKSLRDALARFERLNIDGILDAKVALALADLGRHLADMGFIAEGQQALERARDIQQELIPGATRVIRFRQNLGATLTTLGNLHSAEMRLDEALRDFEASRQIFEELAQSPQDRWDRAELARSLNNVGLVKARLGRADDGRRNVEGGLKIREELLADQPLNIEYRAEVARSYFHLAMVQASAGASSDALPSIRKAEELYTGIPPKGPEDVYFQACLKAMRAGLVAAGKSPEQLSPAEQADRRHTGDEAMERLKEAVAAGYRSPALMKNDPPLDPLRSRPDFQELLRSLERPSQ